MRCVRHVAVVVSALATLMLACSSPDSAAVGPKSDVPAVGDGGVMPKEAGVASTIQANVRFLLTSTSPSETLLPNTSYDLTFEIEIHSSHDERFQLVPHIDAAVSTWRPTVT